MTVQPHPLTAPVEPVAAYERSLYLLDRSLAPSRKVQAFARAAGIVLALPAEELAERARSGTLQELPGIGASTAGVITDALAGRMPRYLTDLEADAITAETDGGRALRSALRGDCHCHSLWSDGGASILDMATTAMALGHEYLVLTDHSPRLTIAHGLNRDRLLAQLAEIEALNEQLAPFRILTGMEVDILDDGTLDLDEDLLARLDVVVASVHRKLSMDRLTMTKRMVHAVTHPAVSILGHCTGRKLSSDGVQPASDKELKRPPSDFDHDIVFLACAQYGTAVEINCRPERQDPPDDLLAVALELGCLVSIDTDAHAPGQLEWQPYGCDKAAAHGIPPERIVNTWTAEALTAWAATPGS